MQRKKDKVVKKERPKRKHEGRLKNRRGMKQKQSEIDAAIKDITLKFTKMMKERAMVVKEGYQIIMKVNGIIGTRCQATVITHGKSSKSIVENQCKKLSIRGVPYCKEHGGGIVAITKSSPVRALKKEMNIWGEVKSNALRKHLNSLDKMSTEELNDVNNDIKLLIALLRNYLSRKSDKELENDKTMKMILGFIKVSARAKNINWDIRHGGKFSFTTEQVKQLFSMFGMAVLEIVKDPVEIEQIRDRFKEIYNRCLITGLNGSKR